MRPAPPRNFVGLAPKVTPTYACGQGLVPMTPVPCEPNTAPLLEQALCRSYMKKALPLLEANRHRTRDPPGDFARPPPQP